MVHDDEDEFRRRRIESHGEIEVVLGFAIVIDEFHGCASVSGDFECLKRKRVQR
ncbi:hypothetical protein L195_g037879 [Trifolium pratense]|uniref:Uncharacterized protein n=1 Tax=Trifolium pratense TaxID=57577 RepID=A0A2K3LTJ0_TRIPR|nr:hypothetical protein L195_g037879 [Trifolium pratense]